MKTVCRCGAPRMTIKSGKNAGKLRILFLNIAHRGVDPRANVIGLGTIEQVIETRFSRQVKDTVGVIRRGVIYPAATP